MFDQFTSTGEELSLEKYHRPMVFKPLLSTSQPSSSQVVARDTVSQHKSCVRTVKKSKALSIIPCPFKTTPQQPSSRLTGTSVRI